MSEMIERVARALYERSPVAGFPWEDIREEWRETARGHARAAIQAMRELPNSLWDEGAPLDPDVIGVDRDPETYWHAIIDAALAQGGSGE